jgi:hypothetical protein
MHCRLHVLADQLATGQTTANLPPLSAALPSGTASPAHAEAQGWSSSLTQAPPAAEQGAGGWSSSLTQTAAPSGLGNTEAGAGGWSSNVTQLNSSNAAPLAGGWSAPKPLPGPKGRTPEPQAAPMPAAQVS